MKPAPQHRKRLKRYNIPNHARELTFSCFRKYPYFIDPIACWIFLDQLSLMRDTYDFELWAYVIMPEHVHLLIHPFTEEYSIGRILRRIKEPLTHRVVTFWRAANPSALKYLKASIGKRTIHRF